MGDDHRYQVPGQILFLQNAQILLLEIRKFYILGYLGHSIGLGRVQNRAGHAPIFADAHRCASMRINRINSKKKSTFLDQNFVILDS